jgi:hypothetical protein
MQIPVLNGIYTDQNSDFRTSYPVNLVPVPKDSGISKGYLRPAEGIIQFNSSDLTGIDRGGINWGGVLYRVIGTKLISFDEYGVQTVCGDVGGDGQVSMDYSFDKLAISSSKKLYYWDKLSVTEVTDSDLGEVVNFIWVDGYFMTTDGTYLVVTELNDPTSVDPLKYGSAEADPDDIMAIVKLRNEPYAVGRYTIEAYSNTGGNYFPFTRISGAQIMRGSIGTHTVCIHQEGIAFLGGGRNEQTAVWFGVNGTSTKISTREIEQILLEYTDDDLADCLMESRVTNSHQFLYLHLPDKTLVYDSASSQELGDSVWFVLASGIEPYSQYRAKNFVWCYGKWICGDPTSKKIGYLADGISSHYGDIAGWEFGTQITYNNGQGVVVHELELVCLSGRSAFGDSPTIWTSYSNDGMSWSQEIPRTAGKFGERNKRISWLRQGFFRHWRCQRFRGDSDCHISIARLEARIEGMTF